MVEGSIWRSLVDFAVPIFLGNLFQQLYNTADTLIVGNFIGKEALAAVSSSGSLINMMVGFLSGLTTGAGVLIAKYYGAKEYDKMSRAIHTGLAAAALAGLAMTAAGVALTPWILRWMGTPETVLPSSVAYFRTYFYGALASFLYNAATGILQAVGDSRRPLYYLMLSSFINVGLDLLFVGGFRWGVASAAAATVISKVVSAALCLAQLARTEQVWRVELRKVAVDRPTLGLIARFGLPSGVQNAMIGLANVVVQANINAFGDDAMAGCGAYFKLEGFAFLPITCFSMALATFVGQNLGAREYGRARRGARFGILCAVVMAELIGLGIFLAAPALVGLFNDDPAVLAYGVRQCRVEALFYCLLAFNHCVAGVLRGAGRAAVPMTVMLLCWCLLRVSYITVAVRLIPAIEMVFSGYPVSWTVSAVIFLIYYLRADWLHAFDRLDARGRG